ncbi:MAG: helix-turn-helix transcriptional regulator [Alphaproteobacteria bacterium]|nr:helix-turn-helix transcriptional regulator [Alphaproteobacteria bacterium]
MNKKTVAPNMVDAYIGQRIRLRRNIMAITQKDLAGKCGITFQQIQKYETSGNRISASRLFQIAAALETPVAFFFAGLTPSQASPIGDADSPYAASKRFKVAEPSENDPMASNETLKLINLYWKLPNDEMRKHIMALLETMGS